MIRWTGEAERGHPYWWEDAPPRGTASAELPEKVDILVIGAGYTGLSAARVAADGGARVAVVDAGQPGQGASTRNGGMFGAHPRLGWSALAREFGADTADALFAEAKPALDWAKALIEAEGIDCDLRQTGRIQLAWTRADFEAHRALAETIRAKSDVAVELRERDELGAEIGTERYFGGIVFPEHCAIHPAKFHAGLLGAVEARGVPVVGDCPVTRLETGFAAHTPRGVVRAEKVILATNGYTTPNFRWHHRRVFPVPSFIIATEPLPEDLIDRLAPGRRMMVETRERRSYYQVAPDGRRILFGGRASLVNPPLDVAAARLFETMCGIWPDLKKTALSHVWTGNTGYSFSHMPRVGEADGLHFAMGYSGSGTVMAPYLGAKAAFRALGDPQGETAYARTVLRPSWLHRFAKPHFLHAADLWYRFAVDPRQTRAGR